MKAITRIMLSLCFFLHIHSTYGQVQNSDFSQDFFDESKMSYYLLRPLNKYMESLETYSSISYGANCRHYIYLQNKISACISRGRETHSIRETVTLNLNGKKFFSIVFAQEGENLVFSSNDDLFRMNTLQLQNNPNYSIEIPAPALALTLKFSQTENEKSGILALFNNPGLMKMEISTHHDSGCPARLYELTCPGCNGIGNFKARSQSIQMENNAGVTNSKYYLYSPFVEVSYKDFAQSLKTYESMLLNAGTKVTNYMINSLGFPSLPET